VILSELLRRSEWLLRKNRGNLSRNNESIIIQAAVEFYKPLEYKHLLLDTSVFIDAYLHPSEFSDFFANCRRSRVTLVTIDPVAIEFVKGSDSEEKMEEKKLFINQIIYQLLPVAHDIISLHIPQVVKEYGVFGKSAS
jgi:hypothetical protein